MSVDSQPTYLIITLLAIVLYTMLFIKKWIVMPLNLGYEDILFLLPASMCVTWLHAHVWAVKWLLPPKLALSDYLPTYEVGQY